MKINPKLKNTSALDKTTLVLGLPVEVFAIALLFSVFGAGWSYLLFAPLRALHVNDSLAWRVWLEVLQCPSLSSLDIVQKDIRILLTHRVIPFSQWRKQ
ncbi:hypothetical protein GNP73_08345 [Aliivibrio fischeri]|uniref:hypothetical protein n=1 Tax=Aliivibrio fischeri TaxID=668 RepID=UPI0012DAD21A|nr:hypothetical protein [Aliivibrio fischeri]MUJ27983.1 hypothetical protein [Aliivibrio fischeri]